LFRGCKSAVSWLFKQLLQVNIANNYNAMAFSKSFCRKFPLKAKYESDIWDCSIMLNYYRNYTESVTELPPEERILTIHNFYLVKTAILILFYGLLRPAEEYKIKTRDGDMIKESGGVCFKVKTKSSFNKDTFIFITKIIIKKYALWSQFVD
jgi:hypothetical protein